jgi:hypothetical protein
MTALRASHIPASGGGPTASSGATYPTLCRVTTEFEEDNGRSQRPSDFSQTDAFSKVDWNVVGTGNVAARFLTTERADRPRQQRPA